jgi:hypothetical protein
MHTYNKYLKQKWGTLLTYNIIFIANKTASGIEQKYYMCITCRDMTSPKVVIFVVQSQWLFYLQ